MDEASAPRRGEEDLPSWYTPKRLLALFCWLTLLIYLDRGVLASNGVNGPIQGEYALTYVQNGFLPAAFVVGLVVASIISSELTKYYNAFRLIGLGFGIWVLSSVACSLTSGFWTLLACRVLMGAGEASIVNLTGPYIDDVAPPAQKTLWFAILWLFPAVGTAGGYVFGGILGPLIGWRWTFRVQALIAVPAVIWVFCVKPVGLKTLSEADSPAEAAYARTHPAKGPAGGTAAGEEPPGDPLGDAPEQVEGAEATRLLASEAAHAAAAPVALPSLLDDLQVLARHPVFLLAAFGYAPIQGAFGAFSYWGPRAGAELFQRDAQGVDLAFGVVTIATSIAATLGGGLALDFAGSSIRNAMALCGWSVVAGFLLVEAAFGLPRGFNLFLAIFALGELALFAGTAPSNAVQVWGVPSRLRSLASGVGTVLGHLLGDVPAPPLVGLLQGRLRDWRASMAALTCYLVLSFALYLGGTCRRWPDYRPPEERALLAADKGVREGLLGPEEHRRQRQGSSNSREGWGASAV